MLVSWAHMFSVLASMHSQTHTHTHTHPLPILTYILQFESTSIAVSSVYIPMIFCVCVCVCPYDKRLQWLGTQFVENQFHLGIIIRHYIYNQAAFVYTLSPFDCTYSLMFIYSVLFSSFTIRKRRQHTCAFFITATFLFRSLSLLLTRTQFFILFFYIYIIVDIFWCVCTSLVANV